MGQTWGALGLGFLNATIDATVHTLGRLEVDIVSCIDLGFRAWDLVQRHGFWIGLRIGQACCCWILLWWWSPYWALFPFRWTSRFILFLHVFLADLYDIAPRDRISQTNTDKDKGKAKSPRLARLERHRRMPSRKYGIVQPVIGESAGPIR